MCRRVVSVVFGLATLVASGSACADSAPQFVVPGRTPGPIIINGYDARWAVVEGDFGLNRPGHVPQVVIGGRYVGPRYERLRRTQYYPTNGTPPVQGRVEDESSPTKEQPQQAESYSRSWETAPANQPVPPADLPPPEGAMGIPVLPPVIVAPRIGPRP